MKRIFTLLSICFAFASTVFAQTSNAVIFAENGEKFTLILNGEKQNATPQANVKLTGLTGEFYQARIDFEDATLLDFTNKNFVVQKGMEVTYVVKVSKKGEYVLRYQSETAISGASTATTPANEPEIKDYVIVEEDVEVEDQNVKTTTTAPGVNITMGTNVTGTGVSQDVVIEEKTTTTTTTKPSKTTTTTTTATPGSEKVNINMNVGGLNMGINMNVEGMDTDMEIEESSSTTVTTTTTTTSKPAQAQPAKPAPAPRQEVVVVEKTTTGCVKAMDKASFDTAKASVASKGFDDTRLTVAKQIAKSNCLTTTQIKDIMSVFGFEETKLEFAKYAYDYCYDKNQYYLINDAFSFDSTIDELNTFIESK
jgi:hypothetical protein